MRKIETEVLVIGGGATGTGVIRDLAMRGFKGILVEKGDLTNGTTGRYHGLLHSGGRYAVKDPQAAKECIEENRILRRILRHCIEDTGGFFVQTPWDDPAYAPLFLAGCQAAGIPVEEVPISQMLREEPLLSPEIQQCFRVPDASADSFLAADANAESARQHGAEILSYHKVLSLLTGDDSGTSKNYDGGQRPGGSGRRVLGARLLDLVKDEEVEITADLVVNASGAWVGQVAASAGITVEIISGKGTMVAVNHRIVNTVINRCKMPGDGDILVPSHTVSVIGTTDIKVKDPDHYAIEPWEILLMLEEGEKLLPGFRSMRMLRAWAGVRPLFQASQSPDSSDNREVTRAFVLLDHESRDGVPGLITITSGKWTTYRKMAEVTVDLVCKKLGVQRECRTHLEPLPGAERHGYHNRAGRLAEVEKAEAYGSLVCECELAIYADVLYAIENGQAKTIDDVRRDVRLGMGPCQGGFCTYRVAGMLHAHRRQTVGEANVALRDFLLERWKGLRPILWGQQLRQERLDELIYLSLFEADHLPGPAGSRLAPILYEPASQTAPGAKKTNPLKETAAEKKSPIPAAPFTPAHRETQAKDPTRMDVLVLGAGLAGLWTAWTATQRGLRVRVVAKGWGANHWHAGCIDILGYLPGEDQPVISPTTALEKLVQENPRHPYAILGVDQVTLAIQSFQNKCEQAGYPMEGNLERNWLLPTSLGTLRPTCLAPKTMIAGDARQFKSSGTTLIAGIAGFPDFYPAWIASNLEAQGFPAEGILIEMESLSKLRFVTGRVLAQKFDLPEFRTEVVAAIKPRLGGAARVGLPAVLGLRNPLEALQDLEEHLGLPVFEIPTLPPSIPGIRLHNLLLDTLQKSGVRVFDGMLAIGSERDGQQVTTVWTEAAARRKAQKAAEYVLATGGILGGGLRADEQGTIHETVFDLPIQAPGVHTEWFSEDFLDPEGHPVYSAGVEFDHHFHPTGPGGEKVYSNLFTVGGALAHCDVLRERSLEGVALASGFAVGHQVGQLEEHKTI